MMALIRLIEVLSKLCSCLGAYVSMKVFSALIARYLGRLQLFIAQMSFGEVINAHSFQKVLN